VKHAMEQLFNPNEPYLTAWTWLYDMDWDLFRPSTDELPERLSGFRETGLYYAALCGFSELADYLISTHGEDVNIRCGRHGSPLHAASSKGHLETVRILLDRGADVDIATSYLNRTPLCTAHHHGHLKVMQLLLDYGANVNVRYGRLGLLSHYALFEGKAEVVRLLMHYKADVNAISPYRNLNWTSLHFASIFGHAKAAEVLLEHGAYTNALNKNGQTSLHEAARSGHLEIVRLLLMHGADLHIQAKDGQTPLQAAISNGRTETVQLLLEYGAKEG